EQGTPQQPPSLAADQIVLRVEAASVDEKVRQCRLPGWPDALIDRDLPELHLENRVDLGNLDAELSRQLLAIRLPAQGPRQPALGGSQLAQHLEPVFGDI